MQIFFEKPSKAIERHRKTEEALQYLNDLQTPVREMTAAVWTGEETADYLIGSKALVAEAEGIIAMRSIVSPRLSNCRRERLRNNFIKALRLVHNSL